VAWVLLVVAAGAAVADWVAVWTRPSRAENLLKPMVLVLLIVAALALDPSDGAQRAWFVVALVLSLAGDVFLLPTVDRFVPGLASFLLAHVAYVVGFAIAGRGDAPLVPLVFVLAGLALMSTEIVRGVSRTDRSLLAPVVVYIGVISTMVAASYWHGELSGIAGAVIFAMSDTILAMDRFVRSRRWMPVAVMGTYHVAQALLVLSLIR
jgi:uncharacterized membrane protein YhhN